MKFVNEIPQGTQYMSVAIVWVLGSVNSGLLFKQTLGSVILGMSLIHKMGIIIVLTTESSKEH